MTPGTLIRAQLTEAGTVKLLPRHIGGFEVRNLDKWRTAGFAAVIAGGGVVAVLAPRVLGGGRGGEGPEGDDPDPDAQIILRIPLSLVFR